MEQSSNVFALELYSVNKALPAQEGRYLVYIAKVEDPAFSMYTKENGFDISDVVVWGSVPKQNLK